VLGHVPLRNHSMPGIALSISDKITIESKYGTSAHADYVPRSFDVELLMDGSLLLGLVLVSSAICFR